MTEQEHLEDIQAWFARHRHDYDPGLAAPPKVWSDHFAWLVQRVQILERDLAEGHAIFQTLQRQRDELQTRVDQLAALIATLPQLVEKKADTLTRRDKQSSSTDDPPHPPVGETSTDPA